MWSPATRLQHSCSGLRYGADLTDREWLILEPLLSPARPRGRRRAWPMRKLVNAILYALRSGCRWFSFLRDCGIWQAACIQDQDGAAAVLTGSRSRFPFIERAFADAGYAGERVNRPSRIVLEIVRKAPGQISFAVQPCRWVVERVDPLRGSTRLDHQEPPPIA